MSDSHFEQHVRDLLTIFTFSKKVDLERYCRNVVINGTAFANTILACDGRKLPFKHAIHWTDSVPPHLQPTDKWGDALAANGVGPLGPDARKVVRMIGQLFRDRRWLVGHMFYTPGLYEWHFIYFDQRDTEYQRANHWREGAHIHFVNWLWGNQIDPWALWSDFVEHNKVPGGALHVRYDDRPPDEIVELARRRRQPPRRPPIDDAAHDAEGLDPCP